MNPVPTLTYPWAVNKSKLERAMQGNNGDEDAIKARYIELGGKVIEVKKRNVNKPTSVASKKDDDQTGDEE